MSTARMRASSTPDTSTQFLRTSSTECTSGESSSVLGRLSTPGSKPPVCTAPAGVSQGGRRHDPPEPAHPRTQVAIKPGDAQTTLKAGVGSPYPDCSAHLHARPTLSQVA